MPNAPLPAGACIIDAHEALAVRSFGPHIQEGAGPLLILPMYRPDGEVCGLEAIDAKGNKGFVAGGKKGRFVLGAVEHGKPLAIVEGLATGISIQLATGFAVVVAFDDGGLVREGKLLATEFPTVQLVVCGDSGNGEEKAGQAARETGAALTIPQFAPEQAESFQRQHGKGPSDFNDLHQLAGLDAVAAQLRAVLAGKERVAGAKVDGPAPAAAPDAGPAPVPEQPGAVIDFDFGRENVTRLAFQGRIDATQDFEELVYRVAPEIQGSALRKATQTALLKQIASKTRTNLEGLRDLAPIAGGGDAVGRGRADGKFLPYKAIGHQIFLVDDQGQRPLCNFEAKITEEVVFDDGTGEDYLFRIEGRLSDGTALPPVEVAASKFAGLSWVTAQWGARPLIHAGNSIRDHLRTAIQGLSVDYGRRTVYGHAGWRRFGDQWGFLHGGGAIFADSSRADIEVRAGEGNMRRYQFEADGGGDLAADVRASMRLLDLAPNNPALGVVLLAAVYRTPLGEAAAIDHGLFLAGRSGSRKSEASAMALAHFGRGFDARHFPANWDDTESDLEAKGHAAKDCLFVADDFKPRGGSSDVHKLHVKADRLMRAVGNQSGRGRRTSDMKQRAALHPRGLVLATGEDIPRGSSLRARMAVVELSLADVDNAVLSELQESARNGALERAMAGYLAWLAGSMDEWKSCLPGYLRAFRDRANQEGFALSHPGGYLRLFVGGPDLVLPVRGARRRGGPHGARGPVRALRNGLEGAGGGAGRSPGGPGRGGAILRVPAVGLERGLVPPLRLPAPGRTG